MRIRFKIEYGSKKRDLFQIKMKKRLSNTTLWLYCQDNLNYYRYHLVISEDLMGAVGMI